MPQETKAVNVWGDWFDRTIGQRGFDDVGFGRRDPRAIAANVINIAMGLLGVLAIILIMYAGFVWTTAGGDPDKVDIAKKILVSASIGLLIILSAWALSIYILSRLWLATGAQGGNGEGLPCSPEGTTIACGCGGVRSCLGGVWGSCVGSDCFEGTIGRSCDSNVLTPTCDADNTVCDDGQYCDNISCLCVKKGGYGDPCDADNATEACQADNNICDQYLVCDSANDSCVCAGEPVIEAISPNGGFCDGSVTQPCLADADCAAFSPATCNQLIPNGAVGNLVTISGRYFLNYQAGTSRVLFWDGSDFSIEAPLANTVNAACSGSWSDNQIVVVVPPGAQSGAVQVRAANGADSSDNDRGPRLPEFTVNGLARPGLCDLSPSSGRLDTLLVYSGLNLNGVNAYFGSLSQNFQANNSNFGLSGSGTARAPNLRSGQTTTFVSRSGGPASNFLRYTQTGTTDRPLVIVGVEPLSGPAGQYITIRGSGFGYNRSNGRVYFGDIEAEYNFPRVCSQSVWRDSEIIVKVPKGAGDGNYKIAVEVNNDRAEFASLFQINQSAVLAPGLCRIDPLFGQVNDQISFWGEYFGVKDAYSQMVFHQNVAVSGAVKVCLGGNQDGQSCNSSVDCDSNDCQPAIMYWGSDRTASETVKPDLATTKVPAGALTGPVKLGKNNTPVFSNTINFTLGKCSQDSQCGGSGVCCPAGTPAAGRCSDSAADCYGGSDACVYEWEFNTGSGHNCPPDRPNACQDGSCCRSECSYDVFSGKTTCLDNASCAGYNGKQCFNSLLCPNSPGNCSFNDQVKTIGATCNCDFLGCADCQYNANVNRCVSQKTCSLPAMVDIDGRQWNRYCAEYQGVTRWHIKALQTCPAGYNPILTSSTTCVDLSSTCDICAGNLSCVDDDGVGRCMTRQSVCPSNFTCQDQVCTRQGGSCECCCDKNDNAPDKTNPACCAPLTCENSCGSGDNFGYCGGCANVGETQAEHDAACNCSGHSGKYCDVSVPGGICRDCSQIGDPSVCGQHGACCVNFKQGSACQGIKDSKFFDVNNIGYCAFYGCGDNCAVPSRDDAYDTQNACLGECPISCDSDTKNPGCQADVTLCPADRPICGNDCLCRSNNLGAEEPCANEAGSCSLLCDRPYGCRGELGCSGPDCAGKPDESTCLCCCNPFNKSSDPQASDFDKCKLLGIGNLFCQANRGSCAGNARGLCCGCRADSECGDPEQVGCGADACCHNRSIVESVIPEHDSQNVCRNSLIRIKLNNKIDIGSLSGNIIVVGDYGDGLCPDGAVLLASADRLNGQSGFFAQLWQKFKALFSKLLPMRSAVAADNHNFCAIVGKTAGGSMTEANITKGYGDFLLSAALSANTKYYVIVRGSDGSTRRTGVLDGNKIGIIGSNQADRDNFNGLIYPNAHIWSFTTGEDICAIDKVVIDPSQRLFQRSLDAYDFLAEARSKDGSILAPLPVYDWQWLWRSDNSVIASVSAKPEPATYQATVTSGNKRDAETFIYARASITKDEINPLSTAGQYKEGRAKIIVFLCENPWPAVSDPNSWPIRWQDEAENCTTCTDPVTQKPRPCQPSDCLSNNFAFYYCRDKAQAGTKDDFPALTIEPPIRGRYKYQSSSLWVDVLKDFYFFRTALPSTPDNIYVGLTDAERGGEVSLSWTSVRDVVYKVYYGVKSGEYDGFVAVSGSNAIIKDLKNNQEYYFAVTAVNAQKVESAYSAEVKILVEDKIAPAKPTGVSAQTLRVGADRNIRVSWSKYNGDALKYIIAYGPNPEPAVRLNVGAVSSHTINRLNNLDMRDYYLQLIAEDGSGNQSDSVLILCAKGCQEDECGCQIQ